MGTLSQPQVAKMTYKRLHVTTGEPFTKDYFY